MEKLTLTFESGQVIKAEPFNTMTGHINDLIDEIDAEKTRAEEAEGDLADDIAAEAELARAAEQANADDIDALEEALDTEKERIDGILTTIGNPASAEATATGLYYNIAQVQNTASANTGSLATLNGNDTTEGSVKKQIKDAINDFATKVSDDNTVNSFKELVDYAADHLTEFGAALSRISELEGKVGVNTKEGEEVTVVNKIQDAHDAADAAQETADDALDKIGTLGTPAQTHPATALDVADGKADKIGNPVIDVAKVPSTGLHNRIDVVDAKADLNATDIKALQTTAHTHANKTTVLDNIQTTDVANWDEAYNKEHDHENKTVIDGITSEQVEAWDAIAGKSDDITSNSTAIGVEPVAEVKYTDEDQEVIDGEKTTDDVKVEAVVGSGILKRVHDLEALVLALTARVEALEALHPEEPIE